MQKKQLRENAEPNYSCIFMLVGLGDCGGKETLLTKLSVGHGKHQVLQML